MLAWLRRLFAPPPSPPAADDALEGVHGELSPGEAWDHVRLRRWLIALDALCKRDLELFRERLPGLRERMAAWYQSHPFEVVWGRDYNFRVIDPLRVTTDEAISSQGDPVFAPWAILLRTLEICTGGPNLFHHGCDLRDVLVLLRDPAVPARIQKFSLPGMEVHSKHEIDALVDTMCRAPCFAGLEHLAIKTAVPLEPRHIEQLAGAPWAPSLRTLDLTETMVDWSVDVADAPRHAALRALSRFTSLTHLFLYNDIKSAPDLAVLLEAPLVNLTHLALGHIPTDGGLLDLLATTTSLPNLQELCLGGGSARTDPAWDRVLAASFPIYLYGQRVTAEYPRRA